MTAEVSHGRGGAGNFNVDDTKYVDGEVVRSGAEGSHGDGAYSAGRGGAGNIGDIGTPAMGRKDQDIIPDAAVRANDKRDHHTGRGGAGNEEHVANGADKEQKAPGTHVGLADKLKGKLFGAVKK